MSINPIAQKILDQYLSFQTPAIPTLSPAAARNLPSLKYALEEMQAEHAGARAMNVLNPAIAAVERITHALIPGPSGDLLARIYAPTTGEPLPVIVYFHGGGWVIANLDTYDGSCRALANATGMIVVSVAYRQAPESKFPAASDDALAAYLWVRQNAAQFGGDPRWVAVAGESAGGNLAAVTCLRARDTGAVPPDFQLLVYPVTDFGFDKPSHRDHAQATPLSTEMMRWFWKHYLNSESDGGNPYASPLRAASLAGLPPAHLVTVEFDPLSDDGNLYADKLAAAGVPVTRHHYDGLMHEAFGLATAIPEAAGAVADAAGQIREAHAHAVSASAR